MLSVMRGRDRVKETIFPFGAGRLQNWRENLKCLQKFIWMRRKYGNTKIGLKGRIKLNIQQKEFKRGMLFRSIGWMAVGFFVCYVFGTMFSKGVIKDARILAACNIMSDMSMVFLAKQFFGFVIITITKVSCKRDNFDSRFIIHFVEFIFIGAFIYSFRYDWNKSRLWIDIVILIFFFFRLAIADSNYINVLKVIQLKVVVDYQYDMYKDMYEEAQREVEQFNLKEQELLEVRAKYAENDSEINKAYRDQRSYTVEKKKNPDYYQFPQEPELQSYVGIFGLFWGKGNINEYRDQIVRYVESLKKAFSNQEQRSRELQARIVDIDDAIRYVEGTEDEKKIEEILGKGVNRAEKARNSYKKLNRRRFERRNRKY